MTDTITAIAAELKATLSKIDRTATSSKTVPPMMLAETAVAFGQIRKKLNKLADRLDAVGQGKG